MTFPLSASDVSLWLAITAIILLTTELLLSSNEYSRNIAINRARFGLVATGLGIAFLVTVVLRVLNAL